MPTLMRLFVESRGLGELSGAPFLMRLPSRPSGREPDILLVATEHLDRIRAAHLEGPADLAVEIVSPESDERAHGAKFVEYEAAGIPEYWLTDPLRREAVLYRLGTDDRFLPGPIEAERVYRSDVLAGFWPRIEWLWQRPLPPVAQILRQIEG